VLVVGQSGGNESANVTLVLEPTDLLGFNLLVTIYYNEDLEPGGGAVFERLVGVGRVANVQQNGLVQVLVLMEVPTHVALWQRIRNREVTVIAQIVVKPSIPYDEAGMEVRFNG
jgi:hypothetical protein